MMHSHAVYGHFIGGPVITPLGEDKLLLSSICLDLGHRPEARLINLSTSLEAVIEQVRAVAAGDSVVLRGLFISVPSLDHAARASFSPSAVVTDPSTVDSFARRLGFAPTETVAVRA